MMLAVMAESKIFVKKNRIMKTLNCENVQASEAGDELFQVSFETKFDSLKDYFLIQRGFEFEDVLGEQIYIESDDNRFTGHNMIEEAHLDRNRFYVKLNDSNQSEIELLYNVPEKDYTEIKSILINIFTRFDFLKIS